MEKRILLPLIAFAIGLVGAFLRANELAFGFEESGLARADYPVASLLIALSAAAGVIFLIISAF